MPSYVASATKQNLRRAVEPDFLFGTTSSAGNAGGTTAVDSKWIGRQVDFFRGQWLLCTSGTNSGEFREIKDFTASSGTIEVWSAFTAQVASSVTYEIYPLPPHLYWRAANVAVQELGMSVNRPVLGVVLPEVGRTVYGVPRNMRDVDRIQAGGREVLTDEFDRADSSTSPGGSWTEDSGNGGISSEHLYFPDDADGDRISLSDQVNDGYLRVPYRGTLNSGATYRTLAIGFRFFEDRTGALDYTNGLLVRLLNGVVDLRKRDRGTETSLATASLTTSDGVQYVTEILFQGSYVKVLVDGVLYLNYELTGLNEKYVNHGIRNILRLDKGGSPATDLRVSEYRLYDAAYFADYTDWQRGVDRTTFEVMAMGNRPPSSSGLMLVEGRAQLSLLDEDTTHGTLLNDTTAVLQIAVGDVHGWLKLVTQARAELCNLAQRPQWNGRSETYPMYAAEETKLRARAQGLMGTPRAPRRMLTPAGF